MPGKDQSRARLSSVQHMEAARSERPAARMGDLHLRRSGLSPKASRRLRRGLKRNSSRMSRRKAKNWLRRWR